MKIKVVRKKKGIIADVMIILTVFMLGWVGNALYSNISALSLSKPSSIFKGDFSDLFKAKERDSPADHITEDKIHVYGDRVVIDVQDPVWAAFTDTDSMDPVLDVESNAIEIVPTGPDQLQVGDIVSYESEYDDGVIIHRIIEIGHDDSGWYAIMKGDNNPEADPGRVRFSQVRRVLVAIIY